MEEKKTTKKTTNSKSSVKSRKKIEKTTLTNEELLEQILNKKKNKSVKPKVKETKVAEKPAVNKQSVEKRLREINKIIKAGSASSDELFDLLKEKKELTKTLNKLKKEEPPKEKPTRKPTRKPPVKKEKPPEEKEPEEKPVEKPKEERPKEVQPVVPEEKEEPVQKKSYLWLIIVIAFVIGIVCGSWYYIHSHRDSEGNIVIDNKPKEEDTSEDDRLLEEYQKCLSRPVDDKDRTESIISAEQDLSDYLKRYKTSVGYEDINTGYKYLYNDNQVYYAASSIKALAALYMYEEASKGNIDLDSTMKYTSRYKWSSSKEMSKVKLNSNVKFRDLVKYAVTVSDNTAYQMLVGHIGRSKLKEFGKSLGAKYTLVGGDNFGSITVTDGLLYWKAINEFTSQDNELARELKSYYLAADQNSLVLEEYGIPAAHKYGEYSPYYNDLGIVYSENPYYVAILTREYGKNMMNVVRNINEHVYELHLLYYENRDNICRSEVYGE